MFSVCGTKPKSRLGTSAQLKALGLCALMVSTAAAAPSQKVQHLIDDLRAGPDVYMTPSAQEFAARQGEPYTGTAQTIVENPSDKPLRAAILLGDMGAKARDAVDALVTHFPKAVHAVTLHEHYVASAGTFEDFVMTKAVGEKNKLIMRPPFLGYEALSKCQNFLTETHDYATASERRSGGRLVEANVTINITFTFYAGACALTRITGQMFGTDLSQWRTWWNQNRHLAAPGSASGTTPQTATAPASSSTGSGANAWMPEGTSAAPSRPTQNTEEYPMGAKYRFWLRTGDEFIGTVEYKDDTTMIAETDEGTAYRFRYGLVERSELVSMPSKDTEQGTGGGPAEAQVLTFEELRRRGLEGSTLEVKIKSGRTFKGVLVATSEDMARLDVDGSTIPIAKSVISRIATVPTQRQPARKQEPKKQQEKRSRAATDTMIVTNPETDEYGNHKDPIVYVGWITNETGTDVTMQRVDGGEVTIKRGRIERIIKHSVKSYEQEIKRYAKSLFCPDDMVLVDVPPGKEGRPFLKVCVDRYEYPNKKGVQPKGNVSYEKAQQLCESEDKRLCTQEEWQYACSGLEGYTYPYGWNYDKEICNTNGIERLEESGTRGKCVTKFGAYDMVGNIFEWVQGTGGNPMVMGGPYSKCQTASPGVGGESKPQVGFRCCKSN